ncbi:hypothetical protein LPB41_27900 [Thalassospira sp. MA62]|nr:hypothetical protein [Thalassospira sp. MA62]
MGKGLAQTADKKKAAVKTAAEFGWDTSKLQKITLFQAPSAPAKNNCPQRHKQKACQFLNFAVLCQFKPAFRPIQKITQYHGQVPLHFSMDICKMQNSIFAFCKMYFAQNHVHLRARAVLFSLG